MTLLTNILSLAVCRRLFSFLLIYIPTTVSYGQDIELKNEVSFGYGSISLVDAIVLISSRDNRYKIHGNVYAQYLRNLNKCVGLGGMIVYEYLGKNGGGTEHLITINPMTRFYWFNNKHFAMYSRCGIGPVLDIDDEMNIGVFFNVSPIACEFGNKHWRCFIEAFSIGTVGAFNGGIKYSF